MAVFTSYDAVGIKEDVSDIITNISPTKTPFQSAIGREKITQKIFQWQEDVLRPVAVNAQVEGFDVGYSTAAYGSTTGPGTIAFDNIQATRMDQNCTQIFAEAVAVSGTMEATSTYGRARESAYQLAKAAAAVKRDLEVALVGGNWSMSLSPPVGGAGSPGTGYSTDGAARNMASYSQMILQNPLTAANTTSNWGANAAGYQGQNVTYSGLGTNYSTASASYSTAVTASEAITAVNVGLTEGALLQSLENCFNNGAEPDCVYVTPKNAWTLANFAKAAGRYRQIQDNGSGNAKQVVNAVDLYVSPYGEIKVFIDRFLNGSDLLNSMLPSSGQTGNTGNPWTLVVDPSMWVLATLRPWFREVLAKTGDNIKQMIVGEFSLKIKNRLGSSMVIDTVATTATVGQF